MVKVPFLAILAGVALAGLGACDRTGSNAPMMLREENAPPDAPLVLRVSGDLDGYYSITVKSLAVHEDHVATRPAAIVVAGCGIGTVQRDLPPEFLILEVDENPDTLERPTQVEACQRRDAAAIARAVEDQVRFALEGLAQVAPVDPHRVVLMASGDAAPVVARLAVPVRGRLLLGDPCIVPWREDEMDTSSTAIVLRGSSRVGRSMPPPSDGPEAPPKAEPDPVALASAISGSCPALPRPRYPESFRVVEATGEISLFGRPAPLVAAAHAAARDFVGGHDTRRP